MILFLEGDRQNVNGRVFLPCSFHLVAGVSVLEDVKIMHNICMSLRSLNAPTPPNSN